MATNSFTCNVLRKLLNCYGDVDRCPDQNSPTLNHAALDRIIDGFGPFLPASGLTEELSTASQRQKLMRRGQIEEHKLTVGVYMCTVVQPLFTMMGIAMRNTEWDDLFLEVSHDCAAKRLNSNQVDAIIVPAHWSTEGPQPAAAAANPSTGYLTGEHAVVFKPQQTSESMVDLDQARQRIKELESDYHYCIVSTWDYC